MANELKHGSVGTQLTQAEWEAVGAHVFDSQATGDIAYASSSSQLSRLGIGEENSFLTVSSSGIPEWVTNLTVGDGDQEDIMVLFDGNAVDFHVGIDDSADEFIIGVGSSLGTTPAIKIDGSTRVVEISTDLKITGDDLYMATNTSGYVLVADGTNYNPVAVSGDVTLASTGAITIANDAVESGMLNDNVISGQTELASGGIAAADEIAISDGGTLKKIGVDNLIIDSPALVSEAAIANGDYVLFLDGGATGSAKKEALADMATLFAGDGLAASSSVLALDLVSNGGLEISSNKLRVATGISQYDVAQFAASVADNDFLRIDGTAVEGLSAAEVAAAIEGSIDAVGTIASGVWQGTAIASGYIAADAITGAKIADDAIDSEHYTDGSIDTAHIADNQVTVGKLADISRGSIIYGNASAATAELTKGSANTVLKSDGTDIAWGSITVLGTIATGVWNGTAIADSYVADALTISGGTVDNSVIGGSTPAAITGTTIDANTDFTIGDTVITNGTITDTSGLTIAAAVDLGSNTLTTTGSLQVRTIDYSDGDNAITIADGGGVTFAQAVDLGSNTLTSTGSLQVRTIDYSDGDNAITIADGGGVTFAQDVTLADDKSITLGDEGQVIFNDVAPSTDQTATGIVIKGTLATGVTVGMAVYLQADGTYDHADKDTEGHMPAVGIALEAAGSDRKILIYGVYVDSNLSLTRGEELYIGDDGAVTHTVPGSGDFLQRVGVALTSTSVLFMPSLDVIEHA